MANKYLNYSGLQKYDTLIKSYISEADAAAIKYGVIESGVLKLYKTASPAQGATPDFSLTLPVQDISGKADKVSSATSGNFAGLDSNGNLTDSGSKAADFATADHTHSDKADKVSGATNGDLAALDSNGNLTDAGAALSTLETKAHAGTIPSGATATTIVGYAEEIASDEADAAQSAAEANSAITISQNGLVYSIYQGGSTAQDLIGTINIPADMVVTAGVVETYDAQHLPTGVTEAGTYIKLTVANATNDKIYIKVTDLVDVYTAAQSAAQVQLAIDQNKVISASIVAGSIGTTELAAGAVTTAKLDADAVTNAKLADDAVQTENIVDANVTAAKLATDSVTTAKIVDGNVTLAKLASGVQTSLGKADTALQPGDFEVITDAEIEDLFD